MNVELIPAFYWCCDECGADNFDRGIIIEPENLSEEELEALRDSHGIDSSESGNWMMVPERVKCCECELEFETKYYNQE